MDCDAAHHTFCAMEAQRRYFLAELAMQLRHSALAFMRSVRAERIIALTNLLRTFILWRNAFAFLLHKINVRSKLVVQLHALHVPQRCAVGECVCQICNECNARAQ